jgi:Zn-finger nucleic acid-binding protein
MLRAIGVELDVCRICGGAFLDWQEVDAFLKRGRQTQSPIADMLNDASSAADIVAIVLRVIAGVS